MTDWPDRPLESLQSELQPVVDDWHAIFNTFITQRVRIDHRYTIPHDGLVCCVSFGPGGRYLATASDQTVRIFEADTGAPVASLYECHEEEEDCLTRSLCFSPDGKFIATGSEDKLIRIWRISAKSVCRFLSGHTGEVYSIQWASDNQTIVSGCQDGMVKVWDINDANARFTFIATSGVSCVSVSADMEYVIAGCDDASIHVWSMYRGTLLSVLTGPDCHSAGAYCVSFLSTTAAMFASGSLDRTVKLWKLPELVYGLVAGQHGGVIRTLKGHSDFVVCIGTTPDACWIISGSKDRTFRIWDAYTGDQQLVVVAHTDTVLSVAASNHYIATGGGDSTLRVWSYYPCDGNWLAEGTQNEAPGEDDRAKA